MVQCSNILCGMECNLQDATNGSWSGWTMLNSNEGNVDRVHAQFHCLCVCRKTWNVVWNVCCRFCTLIVGVMSSGNNESLSESNIQSKPKMLELANSAILESRQPLALCSPRMLSSEFLHVCSCLIENGSSFAISSTCIQFSEKRFYAPNSVQW